MKATSKIIANIANCSKDTVQSVRLKRRPDTKKIIQIENELNEGFKEVYENIKEKYQQK